ncbi:sugar transferase [Rhodoplanes sp. Z2-YC6860]|uniref:sugar transferase n=1 Tax=Rhodoplanes sp. Z2-YC6860 TaxID=674703 RepID=UPI00078E3229|nr:sugar transferase [Rhodoplanes sp. Z2-YC6860]AMN43760.1 sugar transferase [Rhodoplanes sp. Z2-YC6860]
MRFPSSSSFGHLRSRLSILDLVCAAIAPALALVLTDAYILSAQSVHLAILYCCVSFLTSAIALLAFRVSDGISPFFSVHDALNIVKAVVFAQLSTEIILFLITRLEGIPRLSLLIQIVMLGAGLFGIRAAVLLSSQERTITGPSDQAGVDHVIIIGATKLASQYIQFVRNYTAGRRRVVAVLDPDQRMIGRALGGVPVVARPQDLEAVIDDYQVHGIRTDRVLIGTDRADLPDVVFNAIQLICQRRELHIDFISQIVGLSDLPPLQPRSEPASNVVPTTIELKPYFQVKRWIDFFGALIAIVVLSPLFLLTALLVLLDVGSPILFWQQRTGQNASSFLLYKFRTLRNPFDRCGNRLPEEKRLSPIGKLLRAMRLDEMPQLLNVLVGDMSLIGPRPLLPVDQPSAASLRLAVRPGITGWAQVHGGNLLTADEKGPLDDWYVCNASLWVDMRIVGLTIRLLFTGEKAAAAQMRIASSSPALAKTVQQRTRESGAELLRPIDPAPIRISKVS